MNHEENIPECDHPSCHAVWEAQTFLVEMALGTSELSLFLDRIVALREYLTVQGERDQRAMAFMEVLEQLFLHGLSPLMQERIARQNFDEHRN